MECYICYQKESGANPFACCDTCNCKGTNRIHKNCLEELKEKYGNTCPICKKEFKKIIHKPQKKTYSNEDFYLTYQESIIMEKYYEIRYIENLKKYEMAKTCLNKNECCIIS